MQTIDLLLRGAAIGSAIFFSSILIAGATPPRKAVALITFFILIVCYLIVSSPDMAVQSGLFRSVLIAGATLVPVAFTWVVLEILFDQIREKWLWFVVPVLTVVTAILDGFVPAFEVVRGLLVLLLYLGLLFLAVSSGPDDLVEKRRVFRQWFVALMAIFGVIISAVELGFDDANLPAIIFPLQAGTFFALAIISGHWLFVANAEIWPSPQTPAKVASKDSHLVEKLVNAMDKGIWRKEGLTVSRLADHLAVPEHRLRRVINHDLEFRNFSTFINGHRIEAAKRALDDPEHTGRTILEIAYDTGFSSLGPFNKAFRIHTGQSPREYRARCVENRHF